MPNHKPVVNGSNLRIFSLEKRAEDVREITRVGVPFFSKVAYSRSATSLKRRLRHRCFPVNFMKVLTTFLQITSGRLPSQ